MMTEKKSERTVPAFVRVGDAYASVDDIKTDAKKLKMLQSELAEARLTILRAGSLAHHWGLEENFERMLAELIVEARN